MGTHKKTRILSAHKEFRIAGSEQFPGRIGLTGSPATGKKTIGKLLGKQLGLEFLSINDYAISRDFGEWKSKEFLVDVKKLRGKIDTNGRIIVGHLLPYVIPNHDLNSIFVLRCSPAILRKRYLLRGYNEEKISENVEAEALGVIAEKCIQRYDLDKVAEFDTSRMRNPQTVATKIFDIIIGKESKRFGTIDWLSAAKTPSELKSIVQGKYHTFNKTKKDN